MRPRKLTPSSQLRTVVAEWLRACKARVRRGDLQLGTVNRYAYMIRHAAPLMRRRVTDLRCPDIRRWHDSLTVPHRLPWGAGGSRSTKRGQTTLTTCGAFCAFQTLRVCLSWAVTEEGILKANPASGLKITVRPAPGRPLTLDEIGRFWPALKVLEDERIAYIRTWKRMSPADMERRIELMRSAFAALMVILLTGCRLGEAVNARIDQVVIERRDDGDGNDVHVLWPRYKHGPRVVTFGPRAQAILHAQIARARAVGSPFVFPSPADPQHHVSRHYVWATHREVCKRTGIVGATPHDHRHGLATKLFKKRVPKPVISDTLGHLDEDSLKTYLHLAISPLAEEAIRLYEAVLKPFLDGDAGATIPDALVDWFALELHKLVCRQVAVAPWENAGELLRERFRNITRQAFAVALDNDGYAAGPAMATLWSLAHAPTPAANGEVAVGA